MPDSRHHASLRGYEAALYLSRALSIRLASPSVSGIGFPNGGMTTTTLENGAQFSAPSNVRRPCREKF